MNIPSDDSVSSTWIPAGRMVHVPDPCTNGRVTRKLLPNTVPPPDDTEHVTDGRPDPITAEQLDAL